MYITHISFIVSYLNSHPHTKASNSICFLKCNHDLVTFKTSYIEVLDIAEFSQIYGYYTCQNSPGSTQLFGSGGCSPVNQVGSCGDRGCT